MSQYDKLKQENMNTNMQFNDKEFLIEQVKRVDQEGIYGTPIRYWINQYLPQHIKNNCPVSDANILDLGCGSGLYSEVFHGVGVGGSYLGLDLDSNPNWLHHKERESQLDCNFSEWDVHNLETLNNSFNFILAVTSFEHFTNDAQVVAQMASVMEKNGRALIIVPSHPTLLTYGFHGERRYGVKDGNRLATQGGLDLLQTVPICGLPSYLVHLVWFTFSWASAIPERVWIKIGEKISPNHPKWKQHRLRLSNRMFVHLNTSIGRKIHKSINTFLAKADAYIPLLPSAYVFVFKKTAEPHQ